MRANMIRILCYGDSNTWGTIPDTWGGRYDENTRWTRVLAKKLGNKFEIIEEGFRGRNTGFDDVIFPRGNRNGAITFPSCVLSHDPLDFIIIMLGTNDMKEEFGVSTSVSAKNIEENYIRYLRDNLAVDLIKLPKIIIVTPAKMQDIVEKFKGANKKTKNFNRDYKEIAKRNNCLFVDNSGPKVGKDGIHLTAESHLLLADKLYEIIKKEHN